MRIKTFFLRFIAFSIVVYFLWYFFLGKPYLFALAYASKYLLFAMGYKVSLITTGDTPYFAYTGMKISMEGAHLQNYNIVPLVSLTLAVTGVSLKRKGKMLLIGMAVLFLLHLTNFVSHIPEYFDRSQLAHMIIESMGVGQVAVPFLIWFALAYRDIFPDIEKKQFKPSKNIQRYKASRNAK